MGLGMGLFSMYKDTPHPEEVTFVKKIPCMDVNSRGEYNYNE